MRLSKTGGAGGPSSEIIRCRDLREIGERAAESFVRLASEKVQSTGRFSVALAGGTTPRALYQQLANSFSSRAPWEAIHLFWGDERCVPPDHPDSNYRMAYETLISKVPIPSENVHRMPGEGEPHFSASAYEETLRQFFGTKEWPSFDLLLLGVGADGHTASLFPGSSALGEKARWVAASYIEKLSAYRLTLTLPVLNHAEEVHFLIAGKEKGEIVRALLADGRPEDRIPAAMVRPVEGTRRVFVDLAASRLIQP